MPARLYGRLTTFGFISGAVLLIVLGLLCLLVIDRQSRAEQWVRHTYLTVQGAGELVSSLRGCIATSRGFALAGTPGFTARFTELDAEVEAGFRELRARCQDNPHQVQRLTAMARQAAEILRLARGVMDARPGTTAERPAYAGLVEASRVAMDDYRALNRAFVAEEEGLLGERLALAKRESSRVQIALWSVCLVALLMLGLSYVAVRRQLGLLKRAENRLESTVAERTAELAESNRSLQLFSHSVAHDLRSPLRAMEGFAALAVRRLAEGSHERAGRYLAQVQEQAARMDRLITDLLDFAKSDRVPRPRADVDLTVLARSVWDELAGERSALGSMAVLRIEEPLPPVVGDPALLRQVLLNLLGNALKYSADRPAAPITVRGRLGIPPDVRTAPPVPRDGDEGERRVLISIADQGAGFDMADYPRLFGLFQRLHGDERFSGTGIGLAMVKRIIERHGGVVWAEGVPGQGAVFWFALRPGTAARSATLRASSSGHPVAMA